ncbi:unnamed protein product [Paramecium sonneborni]|uniref:Uncharacterized protein n=1 Tax=Paramecium sonneborni TaxID=65129 RepID=A0A8S1RHA0_9CILI|nr:unnamed protein product [Paramecium sonneborni]
MNHIIQQPKTAQKQKKQSKVVSKHPEIQPNKTLDELKNKEWTVAIQKEIDQFESAIYEVESLFKEASMSQHLISLGSFKLVQDEYEFATFKLHNLREMLKIYTDDYSKYRENKQKLKDMTKKQYKSDEDKEEIQRITREQQNFKYTKIREREKIQFQYGVAQRVLILIQAYIKMKDQHEDQHELQKHRDYILQKIEKIKKSEEKHTKKIERHYSKIQVENPDGPEEMQLEQDQSEGEYYDQGDDTAREDLIKLCDSLVSYLTKIEKKEGDSFLQHDLTTFQYFDQIKVAAPFYTNQIYLAIDLIKAKRSFYQNAPDTEFVKKDVQKAVIKQEQKVDVTNEQDFPKLA